MNTSHDIVMFYGEAGVLLKDKRGLKFKSKDGNIYYGYNTEDPETSYSLKIKTLKLDDIDFRTTHELDEYQYIDIVEIGDIKLLINANYNWLCDEVDCKEIEGIGTVYTGKNNNIIAALIDKNGRCVDLAYIMMNIAQFGIDKAYKYLTKELRDMNWKEGRANWQGKHISKEQKDKLRMLGCLGKDPYTDSKAVIIENIGIGFMWPDNVNMDDETTDDIGIFWNGDKYKFYEE